LFKTKLLPDGMKVAGWFGCQDHSKELSLHRAGSSDQLSLAIVGDNTTRRDKGITSSRAMVIMQVVGMGSIDKTI
jgi:hypothetical protein